MEQKWYNVTYKPYAYGIPTLDIESMERWPELLDKFYLCRLRDGTERLLKFVYLNDMNYPEYAFVDEVNKRHDDVVCVKLNMPTNKELVDSFDFDDYVEEDYNMENLNDTPFTVTLTVTSTGGATISSELTPMFIEDLQSVFGISALDHLYARMRDTIMDGLVSKQTNLTLNVVRNQDGSILIGDRNNEI